MSTPLQKHRYDSGKDAIHRNGIRLETRKLTDSAKPGVFQICQTVAATV